MWTYSHEHSDILPAGDAAGQLARRFGGGLRRLNPLRWLHTLFWRQVARTELYELDDRALADLGITRGDFPAILSGSYRRGE